MKTTIRNRAAALAIAGAAGLTGIGLAGGPAMAADAAQAGSATSVDTQSVYYPTDTTKYADELVKAWGAGNTSRVEAFASEDVADALAEHGDDDATHWKRVGGEGAAGTVYVDFENTVTGEKMAIGVSNEAVSNPDNEWGTAHGVHQVQFEG